MTKRFSPMLFIVLFASALAGAQSGPKPYQYLRSGSAQDKQTQPTPGAALMGGGADLDPAFQWLCQRAHGGDFLILRARGTDAYNDYVNKLCSANSVATLVIPSRVAAGNPAVAEAIAHAEAIFIAGGDQGNYINFWQHTPVQDEINQAIQRGVPIGGTSAGLAVLGEFVFTALKDSAVSKATLADPYNAQVTLGADFLHVDHMAGIITDQHFVKRDRLGRFLGFMARLLQDGMAKDIHGIAVDERNAVLLDEHGRGTLVGEGAAYFMHPEHRPEVCQAGTPLTIRDIAVYKIGKGGSFDFAKWSGQGGAAYKLSVENGAIKSTQPGGSPY